MFLRGSHGVRGVRCNAYDMDRHDDHHIHDASLDYTVRRHLPAHNIGLLIESHLSNPTEPKQKMKKIFDNWVHKHTHN